MIRFCDRCLSPLPFLSASISLPLLVLFFFKLYGGLSWGLPRLTLLAARPRTVQYLLSTLSSRALSVPDLFFLSDSKALTLAFCIEIWLLGWEAIRARFLVYGFPCDRSAAPVAAPIKYHSPAWFFPHPMTGSVNFFFFPLGSAADAGRLRSQRDDFCSSSIAVIDRPGANTLPFLVFRHFVKTAVSSGAPPPSKFEIREVRSPSAVLSSPSLHPPVPTRPYDTNRPPFLHLFPRPEHFDFVASSCFMEPAYNFWFCAFVRSQLYPSLFLVGYNRDLFLLVLFSLSSGAHLLKWKGVVARPFFCVTLPSANCELLSSSFRCGLLF